MNRNTLTSRQKCRYLTLFFMVLAATLIFFSSSALFAGPVTLPPVGSNLILQTNGPASNIGTGDWWTNNNPDAGNQPHVFRIYVPNTVDSDFILEIDLYDPECFQTGTEDDQIRSGIWDTTSFELVAPDLATIIAQQDYAPEAATSAQWNSFANFRVGDYGYGIYELYVTTETDDENVYNIRISETDPDGIANNGDEINLLVFQSSFQPVTAGCGTFWFFIPDTSDLTLYNFDMDNNTSVTYTDPLGGLSAGSLSGEQNWNNGGGIPFPPPGGDTILDPLSGWWQAELCVAANNQFVFYSAAGMFIEDAPDYPVIELVKMSDSSFAAPSELWTFRLAVTNTGTGPSLSTTLVDTLPEGVTFISATGSPAVSTVGTRDLLIWDMGTLLPGFTDTLDVTVEIDFTAPDTVINHASISHSDVMFNAYTGITDSVMIETGTGLSASLGGRVWYDLNRDGVQDGSEPGIPSVTVYLLSTMGDTLDDTISNAQGYYILNNVPPGTYQLDVDESTLPAGLLILVYESTVNSIVTLVGGVDNLSMFFGYDFDLVPVELTAFDAVSENGKVVLTWITQSETENLGFNLLRSESKYGKYVPVNDELVPGAGNSEKIHKYRYEDKAVAPGTTYYYQLQDVDFSGRVSTHGPISATVPAVPQAYALEQNYPNPFNSETRIVFKVKQAGHLEITIYNLIGQKVRTLLSEEMEVGEHKVSWDGKDDSGYILPSGIYLYSMQINDYKAFRKMTFTK